MLLPLAIELRRPVLVRLSVHVEGLFVFLPLAIEQRRSVPLRLGERRGDGLFVLLPLAVGLLFGLGAGGGHHRLGLRGPARLGGLEPRHQVALRLVGGLTLASCYGIWVGWI